MPNQCFGYPGWWSVIDDREVCGYLLATDVIHTENICVVFCLLDTGPCRRDDGN